MGSADVSLFSQITGLTNTDAFVRQDSERLFVFALRTNDIMGPSSRFGGTSRATVGWYSTVTENDQNRTESSEVE